jgi:aspartate carbamoyltransferase regulatory subunit
LLKKRKLLQISKIRAGIVIASVVKKIHSTALQYLGLKEGWSPVKKGFIFIHATTLWVK